MDDLAKSGSKTHYKTGRIPVTVGAERKLIRHAQGAMLNKLCITPDYSSYYFKN